MKSYYCLLLLALVFAGCKKDKPTTPVVVNPPVNAPKVTNTDYIDSLLFVPHGSYQITTSEPATFSSPDGHVQINSTGYLIRVCGAEVAPVLITWKNTAHPPTTIYVLGADDAIQDYPFTLYHSEMATDAYNDYVQGWKTLMKLPVSSETYAIVMRHADASYGLDYTSHYGKAGPDNWWKSPDSLLARQLNAQGITRATEIGQVFKDLKYPIARIITSEFYRARQTVTLMNMGITPTIDSRVNHPSYNQYVPGLYQGMVNIIKEQPVDNKMTLIVAHHPINELKGLTGYPSFPSVSPFNWTGAYLVKIYADKTISYEGSVSWGMFKCWRNLKLHTN